LFNEQISDYAKIVLFSLNRSLRDVVAVIYKFTVGRKAVKFVGIKRASLNSINGP